MTPRARGEERASRRLAWKRMEAWTGGEVRREHPVTRKLLSWES